MGYMLKPVRCDNCKYFERDKRYTEEGTCKIDGEYTREHRVCNHLDTNEKKREAKIRVNYRWWGEM